MHVDNSQWKGSEFSEAGFYNNSGLRHNGFLAINCNGQGPTIIQAKAPNWHNAAATRNDAVHPKRLAINDVDAVLKHAQTVVIGNNDPEFRQVPARLREDQYLVDFIRVVPGKSQNGKYDGICW